MDTDSTHNRGTKGHSARHSGNRRQRRENTHKKHKGGNKKDTIPAVVRNAVVSAQEGDAACASLT